MASLRSHAEGHPWETQETEETQKTPAEEAMARTKRHVHDRERQQGTSGHEQTRT